MSASLATSSKIKVLVVDDMLTYRTILTRVLREFPDVEVSGSVGNGKLALEQMQKVPADLILMDLEMPVMDGLQTLPELRRLYPKSQVVLISGTNRSSADLTLQALQLGAMDFIPKPSQDSFTANIEALKEKIKGVLAACQSARRRVAAPLIKPLGASSPAVARTASSTHKFDILAIGVSTGGPNALTEFLPGLPANLGVPVVLVQHMPAYFTASLANMLNHKCALTVKEAEDNEALINNTIYIAPGGRHLSIKKRVGASPLTILTDTEPVNSCRPAVDVLFNSLPAVYGANILSIVLTGMGSDGMVGVRTIKGKGGYSLTQTEQSCVVYGMPKAVDDQGLSDERVDIKEMANRVKHLLNIR
jgi:two-component system chemotaxis response regulator CheB